MVLFFKIVLGSALCVQAFIGFSFFISSIWEKEKRASWLGGIQFILMFALVVVFFGLNTIAFFDSGMGTNIMIVLVVIGVLGTILLFSKIGANPAALEGTKGVTVGPIKRIDERDIQFSDTLRMKFLMKKMGGPKGGSPPSLEKLKGLMKGITDEEMNAAGLPPMGPPPDIGKIDGALATPVKSMTAAGAYMQTNFATPTFFKPPVAETKYEMTPEIATTRVKGYAKHLGACLVGITELDQNWVYSHRGCSEIHLKNWGGKVEVNHKYAIVFAEEMDRELIDTGPHTPIVLESMKNYAKGGFIGAQLAFFIANLGHDARSNHGGHYDCMVVPMAVDAGLGELSRMGYLISKEYGPRIRLSAVTTDLPLVPDKPIDIGVKDFCRVCKKCADTCPSKSIPTNDHPEEVNGTLRWKLDGDSCIQFWQKTGTDCGICMRVCPFSHARTFPHRIIMSAVSRNRLSRILFNKMGDIFYVKHPLPKDAPDWAKYT